MTKVTKPGLPRPDSTPRVESDDSAAWDALPDLPATLQAVIDAVPAIISAKDKDSRYLVINRWQAELYGVTPAQAVGKTAADLINAEYGALTRDRDLQVLSSGEPLPYFEEEFLGFDNDQRTMLTTKAPLADGLGRVVGVVTASLDITERKRTEAALRESEAKTKQAIMILTSAIESMNDGFVLFDGDDRLVMCNQRYREYYPEVVDILVPGTSLEELTKVYADRAGLYSQPAERERFILERRKAWKEGRSMVEPTPVGRWIETRDKAADGGYWVGIRIDVTERRRAEQALWESEERYRSLFEAAPISLWEQDWSAVKAFVEQVQTAHGEEFGSLLKLKPELLGQAAANVRTLAVNEATVKLFGAKDKKQLLARFEQRSKMAPYNGFKAQLRGLLRGRWRVTTEYEDVRESGECCHIRATLEMPNEYRNDWKRVFAAVEDITEARALSQQLKYQATHDELTGLVNRREFENRLERVLRRAGAEHTEHAVCYLDLDQFKVINDTCGHVAGDELLRKLGVLLARQVRRRDTLARLGGDEFGVLLEHCSLRQGMRIADALRSVIDEFRFVWGGQSFSVGVSIGLVPIRGEGAIVADVLSAADAACYAAKDLGRNRIHVYNEDDVELTRRHGEMQWVSRVQRAIEEGRFVLAHQPIVPLSPTKASHMVHYELLLRMQGDDEELILPASFLGAAERYNLSSKLDRWVVQAALRLLSRNRAQLAKPFLCSINLSGLSLLDEEFLGFVVTQLSQHEIPPQRLCFEITETAAISNLSSAIRFVDELRGLGCRFALDDFGSGLSSFAYLKNLPVDFLKIDGVFVRDIVDDPIDRAMVKSINDIGHVMGKQTIAEFVESEAILEVLTEIGVDYGQGFATGKPELLAPD